MWQYGYLEKKFSWRLYPQLSVLGESEFLNQLEAAVIGLEIVEKKLVDIIFGPKDHWKSLNASFIVTFSDSSSFFLSAGVEWKGLKEQVVFS